MGSPIQESVSLLYQYVWEIPSEYNGLIIFPLYLGIFQMNPMYSTCQTNPLSMILNSLSNNDLLKST